jgi:hypothetical protein
MASKRCLRGTNALLFHWFIFSAHSYRLGEAARHHTIPNHNYKEIIIMDAVAILSIASVAGSIVVFIVLGILINRLINKTHSQD